MRVSRLQTHQLRILASINPDQRKWWLQLLDGEATAGQLQLINRPRQARWELHVPLKLPTSEPEVDWGTCTPVGVFKLRQDGVPLVNGRPVDPLKWFFVTDFLYDTNRYLLFLVNRQSAQSHARSPADQRWWNGSRTGAVCPIQTLHSR